MRDQKYIVNKSTFAIKIGDRIHNAHQEVSWIYDGSSVSDSFDFGNEKQNQEYLKKFESGELLNIIISVEVSFDNWTGVDHLVGCHVRDKYLLTDIESIVSEHGMQKIARDDLKKSIEQSLKSLFPTLDIGVNTEYGIEVSS